uniref:Seven TM Receptor n=1 Tax=Panagrolaimus sp. JU765 TaxID=591449 RepID=A0AC34QD62_9BILA
MDITPKLTMIRVIGMINEIVCTFIGLFLNILLLFLITRKTTHRMKEYKIILFQNCILDLLYNILNAFLYVGWWGYCSWVTPELVQKKATLLLSDPHYADGIPKFMTAEISNPIFLGAFIYCYFLLCFVYAIIIFTSYKVFKHIKFTAISPELLDVQKQITIILTVQAVAPVLVSLLYVGWWGYCSWVTPELVQKKSTLLLSDPHYADGIPKFMTAEISNPIFLGAFIYCYFLLCFVYAIIIFTSYKVFKHIKFTAISPELLDVQKQITIILTVQAVAPVLVCLFPVGIYLTGSFLYLDIPGLGFVVGYFLPWIPIANSLITILAIRSYRQYCFSWFKNSIPNTSSNLVTLSPKPPVALI